MLFDASFHVESEANAADYVELPAKGHQEEEVYYVKQEIPEAEATVTNPSEQQGMPRSIYTHYLFLI